MFGQVVEFDRSIRQGDCEQPAILGKLRVVPAFADFSNWNYCFELISLPLRNLALFIDGEDRLAVGGKLPYSNARQSHTGFAASNLGSIIALHRANPTATNQGLAIGQQCERQDRAGVPAQRIAAWL